MKPPPPDPYNGVAHDAAAYLARLSGCGDGPLRLNAAQGFQKISGPYMFYGHAAQGREQVFVKDSLVVAEAPPGHSRARQFQPGGAYGAKGVFGPGLFLRLFLPLQFPGIPCKNSYLPRN